MHLWQYITARLALTYSLYISDGGLRNKNERRKCGLRNGVWVHVQLVTVEKREKKRGYSLFV